MILGTIFQFSDFLTPRLYSFLQKMNNLTGMQYVLTDEITSKCLVFTTFVSQDSFVTFLGFGSTSYPSLRETTIQL